MASNGDSPSIWTDVLLVDDSLFFRNMMADLLEKEGLTIRVATNGREALETLEKVRVKVLVTDWMMPEMDGLELCKSVRATEGQEHLYIILLTSKDRVEDAVDALQHGADDFINKGADPREVLMRVSVGLRVHGLFQALKEAERNETVVEMAATLGHEIFNPLQVITGFAELMAQDASLPERRQRNAQQILDSARRIHTLVKQLQQLRSARKTTYLGETQMIDPGAENTGEGSADT